MGKRKHGKWGDQDVPENFKRVRLSDSIKISSNSVNLKSNDFWSDDSDYSDEDDMQINSNRKSLFHQGIGLSEAEVKEISQKKSDSSEPKKNKPHSKCITGAAKKNHPPPEIIVFQDPALKHKKKTADSNKADKQKVPKPEVSEASMIDLRTARQEVHRFGVKGLEGNDKDAAMLELLVKLGAKAPKKKYVNYKQFIEEKQVEKRRLEDLKSNRLFMDEGRIKALQSFYSYQKKLKKNPEDIGPIDGRHVSIHGVKVKQRDAQRMSHRGGERGGRKSGRGRKK